MTWIALTNPNNSTVCPWMMPPPPHTHTLLVAAAAPVYHQYGLIGVDLYCYVQLISGWLCYEDVLTATVHWYDGVLPPVIPTTIVLRHFRNVSLHYYYYVSVYVRTCVSFLYMSFLSSLFFFLILWCYRWIRNDWSIWTSKRCCSVCFRQN